MASNQRSLEAVDMLKWFIALGVFAGGIFSFYHFASYALPIRVIGMLVVSSVVLAISVSTTQGVRAWEFAKAARQEMRRVVWPTRQETVQATIMVLIMVTVLGFVLWILDSLLLRAVAWLTGHGG